MWGTQSQPRLVCAPGGQGGHLTAPEEGGVAGTTHEISSSEEKGGSQ